MWETKRLLIWGKTYPEFSRRYYETVCTGAIDGSTGNLVRIYPITLRYQKEPFKLYDWIEARVERNTSDFRPESHRIDQTSIKVVGNLSTADGWAERSEWVLRQGNTFPSVEALVAAESQTHTSMGVVRPKTVKRVYAKQRPTEERDEWEQRKKDAVAQRDLFVDPESEVRELAWVPIQYRVEFTCDDNACRGHDCSVLDWGLYVLHRRMYAQTGSPVTAQAKVIQHLEEILDGARKNVHLFMGNTKSHTRNFMILGVYYPPIVTPKREAPKEPPRQGSLF